MAPAWSLSRFACKALPGMVLIYKVLGQGNVAWPKVQDGTMRLSRAQGEALFEGISRARSTPA